MSNQFGEGVVIRGEQLMTRTVNTAYEARWRATSWEDCGLGISPFESGISEHAISIGDDSGYSAGSESGEGPSFVSRFPGLTATEADCMRLPACQAGDPVAVALGWAWDERRIAQARASLKLYDVRAIKEFATSRGFMYAATQSRDSQGVADDGRSGVPCTR